MKPKSGNPRSIRMSFPQSFQNDAGSAQVKFDLYLKSREIKQISQLLQKTLLFKKKDRKKWLNDNEDFINQLLGSFMDDSMMVLDGIKLDPEAMELSVSLISDLREAVTIIQNLLYDNKRLQG